mmetsp:Transcript_67559/g.119837  ORF Transcript_67559/g.119837 Transcript_67559/m.119837 type:complete len:211 (-) Transcript_67559:5233-5865(-)
MPWCCSLPMYSSACCCRVCVLPSTFPLQMPIHSQNSFPTVARSAGSDADWLRSPWPVESTAADALSPPLSAVEDCPSAGCGGGWFAEGGFLAILPRISKVFLRSFWVISCSSTKHRWTTEPANSTIWRETEEAGCCRASVSCLSKSGMLINRNRMKLTAIYLCCHLFSCCKKSFVSSWVTTCAFFSLAVCRTNKHTSFTNINTYSSVDGC